VYRALRAACRNPDPHDYNWHRTGWQCTKCGHRSSTRRLRGHQDAPPLPDFRPISILPTGSEWLLMGDIDSQYRSSSVWLAEDTPPQVERQPPEQGVPWHRLHHSGGPPLSRHTSTWPSPAHQRVNMATLAAGHESASTGDPPPNRGGHCPPSGARGLSRRTTGHRRMGGPL
jgi:hypothetical protein